MFCFWGPRPSCTQLGDLLSRPNIRRSSLELCSGTKRDMNLKKCQSVARSRFAASWFQRKNGENCQAVFKIIFDRWKSRSSQEAARTSFCGDSFLRREFICKIFAFESQKSNGTMKKFFNFVETYFPDVQSVLRPFCGHDLLQSWDFGTSLKCAWKSWLWEPFFDYLVCRCICAT